MAAEYITSRKNPIVQQIKRLQASRAYRRRCGLFPAEGVKLLEEAIKWYDGLDTVLTTEHVEVGRLEERVRHIIVPDSLMSFLSEQESPQGALFLCRLPQDKPLCLQRGALILDSIQDPGNLGTILRTADALEVPVVLSEGCADPFCAKTVRASMGAVFRTPPQLAAREAILSAAEQAEIPIAVTALSPEALDLREADLRVCATVIGSEGRGVCEDYLQAAAQKLMIPMNARCESLNAAVAATIVMWQMRR